MLHSSSAACLCGAHAKVYPGSLVGPSLVDITVARATCGADQCRTGAGCGRTRWTPSTTAPRWRSPSAASPTPRYSQAGCTRHCDGTCDPGRRCSKETLSGITAWWWCFALIWWLWRHHTGSKGRGGSQEEGRAGGGSGGKGRAEKGGRLGRIAWPMMLPTFYQYPLLTRRT